MEWLPLFEERLSDYFTLSALDCQELAQVITSEQEEIVHSQFVNGGIERAVNKLLEQGKSYDVIMGISVGGIIGWKALLAGLKASRFYGVSATRLRYEQQAPACPIRLIYGEADSYKPTKNWMENYASDTVILPRYGHGLYRDPMAVEMICRMLKMDLSHQS